MNIQSAARALHGEVSAGCILAPGPGHSRHDRSMSVRFNPSAPQGIVVNSFAGDDWRDCRDHVKAALGITDRDFEPVASRQPRSAPPRDTQAFAKALWQGAAPLAGTPTAEYLAGRGLDAGAVMRVSALRHHGHCKFKGETVAVMLAAMVNIQTNAFQGIHRTRLDPKDKAMLGTAKGAVVKLSPDSEVTNGLSICEGIETGLALLSEGIGPVWACLSAGGLATFPVLPGVEALTIYADHDENGTGQEAARACGGRWQDAGLEVAAFAAPKPDTDFLDWRVAS